MKKGEPRRARIEHLEVGLGQLLKHEIKDLLPQAERDIARSFLQEGLFDEAEGAAKRALEAASEPLSWTDLGSAQRIMGQVYHGQGRLSEGEALLKQSLETLRGHGPRYELARTYLALGAKLDLGKIDELDSRLASGNTSTFEERSEGDV